MGKLMIKTSLAGMIAIAMAMSASALAQADKSQSWDVNNPPLKTRNVPIQVDEGTWMNLDVSPDGETIIFDLLGDIYLLPISGGEARRISSGMAWDAQPRFSPDGRSIAFTSDRGGGDNIWLMDRSGGNMRALTDEKFRLLNNPTWSPDGRYIAARKHFTTGRSLGTGEIWLYHIGGGNGVALVERPNMVHQKELGEPIFDPSGKGIYYSRDATSGPIFEYAQDSNGQVFVIDRYDLASGEVEQITGGPGGAARPTPSPDGKWLAFVRRERAKTKLYIRDLQTGAERKIHDEMDQDLQEIWAVHGVYPNMDWLPNSSELIFWTGGKIHRINPISGAVSQIPFRVNDNRTIADPIRPQVPVFSDRIDIKMPRFARRSPDGGALIFEALGKLYRQNTNDSSAQRLTADATNARELFPAFSPDGRKLVYVRWTDHGAGELRMIDNESQQEQTISPLAGHYRRPQFSSDGNALVVEVDAGGGLLTDKVSLAAGIYLFDIASGQMRRIAKSGHHPHFGPHFGTSDQRVYFTDGGALKSVNLNGHDQQQHASGELVSEYHVSPDGKSLAFIENYQAWLMPFLPAKIDLGAGKDGRNFPIAQLSDHGANYVHWRPNSGLLDYSLGDQFFTIDSRAILDENALAKPEKFTPPLSGSKISLSVAADQPSGQIALVNARIATMADRDGGVIERGMILIEGNRIKTIVAGDAAPPAGAKTMDMAGKTIIPGLIDAHAHGPQGDNDIIPEQNWSAVAHLALGVTSIHDPSNQASHIFAASEYQRAGKLLAPRLFSTGEIVYGAKAPGYYAEINNIDDARAHIKRLKAQGAHSVKNYNQPRRDQRQQVVKAAQEAGIITVAEGGSLYEQDMALIADGNTTIEHNLPQSKLYEDVLSYFSQGKVGYTPTLVVTFGGGAADPYWRAHSNVWQHPILSRHVPPKLLAASSARREIAPEEDYYDQVSASQANALAKRGVMVSIGGHGQQQGLAAHWELWSFVRGGMSPLQALRAGTIEAARSLGFDRDIGSIEVGKLADLVVIDGDPLADIKDSDNITHVMLGGRLYQSETMNEVLGNEILGNEILSTETEKSLWYWQQDQ